MNIHRDSCHYGQNQQVVSNLRKIVKFLRHGDVDIESVVTMLEEVMHNVIDFDEKAHFLDLNLKMALEKEENRLNES